jgi:diguanylate cyclase (GGDEF)-like protein
LLELRDRARLADLTDANARLELLARTDPLTGIANRRWMIETLNRVGTTDPQQAEGVAILVCDVDHFKQLNDSLGHAEGDRCLVKVAGIIQSSLHDDRNQVARYDGEEFPVLLRGTNEQDAITVAERIRSRVEAASLPTPGLRLRHTSPSASGSLCWKKAPVASHSRHCNRERTKPLRGKGGGPQPRGRFQASVLAGVDAAPATG